jgi:hypothetical protein
MTKQEAIQEQIDQIMDAFDFRRCIDLLEAIRLKGDSFPKHWHDAEFGWREDAIRADARRHLRDASKYQDGEVGGAYFTATSCHGTDEGKPWVRLDLHFGLRSINDGTSYEE